MWILVIVIGVVIFLGRINPEIDELKNKTILWYTPINKKSERKYITLWEK